MTAGEPRYDDGGAGSGRQGPGGSGPAYGSYGPGGTGYGGSGQGSPGYGASGYGASGYGASGFGSSGPGASGGNDPSAGGPPVCPRHPSVVSYVRCQRCGRPTCPQCQRPAPVGIRCVDCANEAQARAPVPRTVAGARIRGGRPTVTYTLIGISAAVFLLQMIRPDLMQYGFFVPVLGWSEPWRFLTSAFFHVGLWHLLLNMYALYIVGPTLETVLGRARYLALYLLSALGGSVAVLLLADPHATSWFTPVAGASGAIFGLFGALALAMRRMKRSDTQILILIAINVVIGFVVPGISWQGHLGGLVVGAMLAAIYLFTPRQHRSWTAVAASVLTLVVLVVLSLAKYGVL